MSVLARPNQPRPKLKVGKWYRFKETYAVGTRTNETKSSFKAKVIKDYGRYYLLEDKRGLHTTISKQDLMSNWRAELV